MSQEGFASEPLHRFLERVAAERPTPAGGSTAAVGVALAAALLGMVARRSRAHLADHAALLARADDLRREALALADEDAAAYEALLGVRRSPEGPERPALLRRAFERATDAPLEVARLASEAARLAGVLRARGHPALAGDALVALLLAQAAARGAAALVEENVRSGDLPLERLDRSAAYLSAADAAPAEEGPAGEGPADAAPAGEGPAGP